MIPTYIHTYQKKKKTCHTIAISTKRMYVLINNLINHENSYKVFYNFFFFYEAFITYKSCVILEFLT
jgi:hypothetical protein